MSKTYQDELDRLTAELEATANEVRKQFMEAMKVITPVVKAMNKNLTETTRGIVAAYREWFDALPDWMKYRIWEQSEVQAKKERHYKKYQRMMSRKRDAKP